MLRLTSQATHSLGAGHVCAPCRRRQLFSSHPPRRLPSLLLWQHGNRCSIYLSARRSESQPKDPPTEEVAAAPKASKKYQLSKRIRAVDIINTATRGSKSGRTTSAESRLEILEGALAALKDVMEKRKTTPRKKANPSEAAQTSTLVQARSDLNKPVRKLRASKHTDDSSPDLSMPLSDPSLKDLKVGPKQPRPKKGNLESTQIASEHSTEMPSGGTPSKEPFERLGKGRPLQPVEAHAQPPVPSLAYGLDRVLFNSGVYELQDHRTRVFNFDPYLSKIMPIQEFDFDALKQYVTSSKDETLIEVARKHGKKFTGSTSSMTSMLSHFHYLLSSWRSLNAGMLSKKFPVDSTRFSRINRAPAAAFIHWKDGVYAIDADKQFDTANILMSLGKSMEKLLTLPKESYERYRKENSHSIPQEERDAAEAFHYTSYGDFMMRSQLDAHDPRLPGTGMFDLKTRAVVSIRMDAQGFEKGLGYQLLHKQGEWESFEREYYDMMRSAFMKYSLQVRMGRMDGIFVAYHNTQQIFGFQYISLSEMDAAIHGTPDLLLGDTEFKYSIKLFNRILDRITTKLPKQTLRLFVETRESAVAPFMYVFAKPVQEGEIKAVQDAGKAKVEEFERELLGAKGSPPVPVDEGTLESDEDLEERDDDQELYDDGLTRPSLASVATTWDEVRLLVEKAVEDDEGDLGALREAVEDALEESGLLESQSLVNTRLYVDALLAVITDGRTFAKSGDSLASSSHEAASDIETRLSTKASDAIEYGVLSSEELGSDAGNGVVQSLEDDPDTPMTREVPETDTRVSRNQTDDSLGAHRQTIDTVTASQERAVDGQAGERNATLDNGISGIDEVGDLGDRALEHVETAKEILDDTELTKHDGATPNNMASLRTLILQLAQRIDERMLSEATDSRDDAEKLEEFEHILKNLIEQFKSAGAQAKQEAELGADSKIGEPASGHLEKLSNSAMDVPTDEEGTGHEKAAATRAALSESDKGVIGYIVTIRNLQNGEYVARPEGLAKAQREGEKGWQVEYNIEKMAPDRAQRLFEACKTRRRKAHEPAFNKDQAWYSLFEGSLDKRSQRGRSLVKSLQKSDRQRPVYVVGDPTPRVYEDVFKGAKDRLAGTKKARKA